MLKQYPVLFALAHKPGNNRPRASELLLWFACWLFTGDLCRLCRDCVLCTAFLMGHPDLAALTIRTR